MKGKRGDHAWTDYLMSKRFGINWKKEMSLERQEDFKLIMELEPHVPTVKPNVSKEREFNKIKG